MSNNFETNDNQNFKIIFNFLKELYNLNKLWFVSYLLIFAFPFASLIWFIIILIKWVENLISPTYLILPAALTLSFISIFIITTIATVIIIGKNSTNEKKSQYGNVKVLDYGKKTNKKISILANNYDKFFIGNREKKWYFLNKEKLFKHILLLGETGGGKTNFIKYFVSFVFVNKTQKMIFIDGKNDPELRNFFLNEKTIKNLSIVASENKENKIKYNFIKNKTPRQIITLLQEHKEERNSGQYYIDEEEKLLLYVLNILKKAAKIDKEKYCICLKHLLKYLNKNDLKELLNFLNKKEVVTNFELKSLNSFNQDEIFLNLCSDISKIIENKNFIANDNLHNDFTIETFLNDDSKKYLLFQLNTLDNQKYSTFLGRLIVNDIKQNRETNYSNNNNLLLVMDEFSSYINEAIIQALKQLRQFNFQLLISTQTLSGLNKINPYFVDELIGLTTTKIFFKTQNPTDQDLIGKLFGTYDIETASISYDMSNSSEQRTTIKKEQAMVFNPSQLKRQQTLTFYITTTNDEGFTTEPLLFKSYFWKEIFDIQIKAQNEFKTAEILK